MGGGPIIIIDPPKVKTNLSTADAIELLRKTADEMECGLAEVGPADETE